MVESRRDRWLSIVMSVLLHGTIIGLLAYGWWRFRQHAEPPTPSIDATVVDARTLKGIGLATRPLPQPKPVSQSKPKPKPVPQPKPKPKLLPQPKPVSPAPPSVEGPPAPTPQELAQRAQLAKAEAQRQAAAEQELLRQQARQKALIAQAAAKAKARKLAEARRLAEERKLAQEKKLAEQRKLAQEKLAAERLAAREKAARLAALAELKRNIRQEEQNDAAARAALAGWTQEIEGRIADAWIKPASASPGIDCVLHVTQVRGGAVTKVSIGRCNGDGAVRESIEAAVYRASPLPPPPDPSLFQRRLIIEFKPN